MFKLGTLACISLLFTVNCARIVMTPPQATLENAQKLRASNMSTVQLGDFTLGPGLRADDDASMSMRGGNSVKPPQGSFTQYMKATLEEELRAAGLLDAKSTLIITGSLVATELHTNIGTATGFVKAHFTVTRDGKVRFDRELTAEDRWDSSFIAAIAVPAAANHYQGLYRKIVEVLIDDKDFQAAVAK
jgi:hypothetical protein